MKLTWKGVIPAITTKFTADDKLDLASFDNNMEAQIAAGINGFVIGGSLGEASTLSSDEKIQLLKHSVSNFGDRVPVIFNIAEQSTRVAIDLAQQAQKAGADGFMLLPPLRYKADDQETVTYFTEIAKNVDLPIMIYNNPVDYAINVTLDMFGQLAEYKNIEAVKESSRDVTNITRMINRFGDRYKILTGVDPLAMESLCLGADGWLAGLVCAFPKETVAIYRLVKENRYDEALAIYRWFLPLLELDIHPKLVQYIKLAEQCAGLGTEYVRAPRLVLSGTEREKILNTINTAIACRPELPAGSWGRVENQLV